MSRLKKACLWLAVIVVLFTVTGFFILPPIVKSVLMDKMSKELGRPVSVQKIIINPYLLTFSLRGFEIKEQAGSDTFLSFEELFVHLDPLSVFKKALILKEIRLSKPFVRIVRNADATYNFSDLLAKSGGTKEKEETKAEPFRFSVNNIKIAGGSLDFFDGPAKTNHKVADLQIAIPFISNMPYQINLFTQPSLSATVNGSPYAFHGQTKPFSDSLETELAIEIKDLNIPYYLAYVPVDLQMKLVSALLDVKINLTYTQHRDKKPTLKMSGDMVLKQLVMDDKKGRPLIRLPQLGVNMTSVEPLTPSLHFSKIMLVSPEVTVNRNEQGEWNLLTLKPSPARKAVAKEKPAMPPEPVKAEKKASAPVDLRIDDFQITTGKMAFKDEKPAQPVSLVMSNLSLGVRDFVMAKNAGAAVSLSVVLEKRGTFALTGPVCLDPFSADLQVKFNQIAIRPFQAYFTDQVKINVTDGSVTASGRANVNDGGGEKGLSVKYNGDLLVANFGSIDKANADDFLKWKSLYFSNVSVGYNPLSVRIGQIALADFFAKIVVNPDGTMNLQNIVEQKEETSNEAPPASTKDDTIASKKPVSETTGNAVPDKRESGNISIDAITLQGGTVDFVDQYVKPNYTANLSRIGGRIAGLSSIAEKPADVEFRGLFNNYQPLEITGRVHPFPRNLYVDLKASFKDVDLSPVSPYSGRHIGYSIQKGKLSLDLKYLIVNKKLESENKVFIDQLTLGDPVESPQALKIPVGLAIALLKDRSGQINLDIPVSGSTDDPKFSIGRLIVQVLVNLITKTVTAPFALLGSLFGGGETLSYLEFDDGRAAVSDAGMKKIDSLVKALHERPALKLDIEGHVDMEKDREGLKNYRMERKVKAMKLNDMIKQGLPAVPLDAVKIESSEYEKYLTLAYLAEPFPKPRTAVGSVKTLPVPEMEKLVLTHLVIGSEDLKLLANQRALAVNDQILKSGKVTPERVFITEPKSLAAEKKDKVKDSRVDFKLK